MPVLGIDLGGTKVCLAIFSEEGDLLEKESLSIAGRTGEDVAILITGRVKKYLADAKYSINAVGACVPGISRQSTGTVWAPNIPGWEDYPLLSELRQAAPGIPVSVDSDRACYILGEVWKGNAQNCKDAIFLAVGTGIGAGILTNGTILRGANDIAGAIGWMALDRPFDPKYTSCGCFEHHASGEGIVKICRQVLDKQPEYSGMLRKLRTEEISSAKVFEAFDLGDPLATQVFEICIHFWGMATANLISLFNPSKIIFGGGVFGPAEQFIERIRLEAEKWAQPISMKLVTFEKSGMGGDAGVYGSAYLALQQLKNEQHV